MRLQAARTVLREIVDRASSDAAYLENLKAHPVETLVNEGLPYDVIEDFLEETAMQPDVTGYLLQGCANTCALTTSAAYPEEIL